MQTAGDEDHFASQVRHIFVGIKVQARHGDGVLTAAIGIMICSRYRVTKSKSEEEKHCQQHSKPCISETVDLGIPSQGS